MRALRRLVKEKAKIADRGHQKDHVRRDQRAHSNTVRQRTVKAKDKDHEVLFPEGTLQTLRRSKSKTLEGAIWKR